MRYRNPLLIVGCIIVLLLGINACTRNADVVIPEGEQTMTGTILPVPLMFTRRGTHLLRVRGADVFFVESTMVNLRDFDHLEVGLTGTIERNTDPGALPVLIATRVTPVTIPADHWELKSLNILLDTPDGWDRKEFDDGVQFTLTGSTTTRLRIVPSTLTQLPGGTPLTVGGFRAVRIAGERGVQTVHVQNGRSILSFVFTLDDADGTSSGRVLTQVLRSVSFGGQKSSVQSSFKAGTGTTQLGKPCGGPAGVLCPGGSYCAISDSASGIGNCRSLQR